MKSLILFFFLTCTSEFIFSQDRFSSQDLSINGFRNPSIGLEYRFGHISVHAGYYLTVLESRETYSFLKTGLTLWALPVDHKPIPSSLYAGVSYLRGNNFEYKNKDALGLEAGFRWMIWK